MVFSIISITSIVLKWGNSQVKLLTVNNAERVMQNRRRLERYSCHRTCQLHWNGSSYLATIKNLSVVVMGVQVDGSLPDITVGATCVIYLYDEQNPLPDVFDCQVIRIGTTDIALSIVDLHRYSMTPYPLSWFPSFILYGNYCTCADFVR